MEKAGVLSNDAAGTSTKWSLGLICTLVPETVGMCLIASLVT